MSLLIQLALIASPLVVLGVGIVQDMTARPVANCPGCGHSNRLHRLIDDLGYVECQAWLCVCTGMWAKEAD